MLNTLRMLNSCWTVCHDTTIRVRPPYKLAKYVLKNSVLHRTRIGRLDANCGHKARCILQARPPSSQAGRDRHCIRQALHCTAVEMTFCAHQLNRRNYTTTDCCVRVTCVSITVCFVLKQITLLLAVKTATEHLFRVTTVTHLKQNIKTKKSLKQR